MGDNSNSAMIALLPTETDWCKIDLPHLTLVYAGEIDKLKPTAFNEMAKEAASLSMISGPIGLRVFSREVFGRNGDSVDVFRLQPTPELQSMRKFVEHWHASEFPYNPHVTIGPVGTFVEFVPKYLLFDRIMVGWGDEQITFWLKR